MKAIVNTDYGSPEVLELKDVPKPAHGMDEILVRVQAASINPLDWKVRRGDFKILTGITPPRIPGNDFSGIVESCGEYITDYQPGDRVWGFIDDFQRGTYAEYLVPREDEIGQAPQNYSPIENASLPTVGLTAYQALVKFGGIQPGHRVLINGCTGGVGLTALQIAKIYGCQVTGVTSTDHLQIASDFGADQLIDYRVEDLADQSGEFDVFFDVVPNRSFRQIKHLLSPRGIYITTLPSFGELVFSQILNVFRAQKVVAFDSKPDPDDLRTLKDLVESSQLVPVVDQVYALEGAAEAQLRSEGGSVVGKLVLEIPGESL